MVYFVATPIGNLKDITFRAVEVLNSVDVIACEDTRNSLKLLNNYNISKKLIAYHKFNEKSSADGIVKLAKENKNIAVISDAGMPVISDPGAILINKLIEEGIEYTVVPGASASLSALLLSGFDAQTFTFVGFLDEGNKSRSEQIRKIKDIEGTLIFYVSPHNLIKDVQFLGSNLGNRRACFVNEITKLYEKIIRFNLCELPEFEIRGEYVLVVEGSKCEKQENISDIEQELKDLIKFGMSKNDAVKYISSKKNISRNNVYKLTLKL